MVFRSDENSFKNRKFIYRRTKCRWRFGIRALILLLQLFCNNIFDFRDFEASSCAHQPGGYAERVGTATMRDRESKTVPGQEKRPEWNRGSHIDIRCNNLIPCEFCCSKTAGSGGKVAPARNSLYRSPKKTQHSWYG